MLLHCICIVIVYYFVDNGKSTGSGSICTHVPREVLCPFVVGNIYTTARRAGVDRFCSTWDWRKSIKRKVWSKEKPLMMTIYIRAEHPLGPGHYLKAPRRRNLSTFGFLPIDFGPTDVELFLRGSNYPIHRSEGVVLTIFSISAWRILSSPIKLYQHCNPV